MEHLIFLIVGFFSTLILYFVFKWGHKKTIEDDLMNVSTDTHTNNIFFTSYLIDTLRNNMFKIFIFNTITISFIPFFQHL